MRTLKKSCRRNRRRNNTRKTRYKKYYKSIKRKSIKRRSIKRKSIKRKSIRKNKVRKRKYTKKKIYGGTTDMRGKTREDVVQSVRAQQESDRPLTTESILLSKAVYALKNDLMTDAMELIQVFFEKNSFSVLISIFMLSLIHI